MLQFLSDKELESRVTSITLRNTEADAIENAIYALGQLFNATPAECHEDLTLLAEALADLNLINSKIEPEEGFEKVYKLHRRESLNNG